MTTLDDIFGQDSAVAWLRQAATADRLPHGLIFAGPTGVGKATTAAALAAWFLCERPSGTLPCGACASCTAFAAGTHPDFHVVAREMIRLHDRTGKSKGIDLSVQVLRPELLEPAGRKPVMGRGKVFLIEQADSMNPQAQNALLKTLEEPAGRTVIILLTDQPGSLLPTIRSRCQTICFCALPCETVRDRLTSRGINRAVAVEAARLSRGSLGLAIRWIEDGVIGPAVELAGEMDGALAGRPPADLPGRLKKAADSYAERQIERDPLASKDQATREGLSLYLTVAAEQARERMRKETEPAELERCCAAIDAIAQAEMYLDANVNTALALQQLAISLEGR